MDRARTRSWSLTPLICDLALRLAHRCNPYRQQCRIRLDQFTALKLRRHLNTWFAFKPCTRATSATLTPGSIVNCTI